MEGKKLEQVIEDKALGILIDDELKFHKQTAAATKKREWRLRLTKEIIHITRQNDTTSP